MTNMKRILPPLILVVAIIIGVAVLGGKFEGTVRDNFPIANYLNNPKTFAGNAYDTVASIDVQLAYKDGVGRILSIKPVNGGGTVALFVPSSLENFNPQVGQKYSMSVKIDESGKLVLNSFKKL